MREGGAPPRLLFAEDAAFTGVVGAAAVVARAGVAGNGFAAGLASAEGGK